MYRGPQKIIFEYSILSITMIKHQMIQKVARESLYTVIRRLDWGDFLIRSPYTSVCLHNKHDDDIYIQITICARSSSKVLNEIF